MNLDPTLSHYWNTILFPTLIQIESLCGVLEYQHRFSGFIHLGFSSGKPCWCIRSNTSNASFKAHTNDTTVMHHLTYHSSPMIPLNAMNTSTTHTIDTKAIHNVYTIIRKCRSTSRSASCNAFVVFVCDLKDMVFSYRAMKDGVSFVT